MSRNVLLALWLLVLLIAVSLGLLWWKYDKNPHGGVIKVGVLHSLTGTMATSEKAIVATTLLAIEELNEKGGLLGKKIVPIVADGKSDWVHYGNEAERLITQEGVVAIFGGWTSSSRKQIKDIVEKYNNLLFYPVNYEGLEQSPNIVYMGATANQQAIPAVTWVLENIGRKLFIVGSDYIFQRALSAIIRDLVKARNGLIVGEEYLLDNQPVEPIINKISETKPDAIINILFGDENKIFFSALRKAGISSERAPTMSLVVLEHELHEYNVDDMIGDYASQNYFESLDTAANREFIGRIKKKLGADQPISNHMENAYNAVSFWALAVESAKSTATDVVRPKLSERALATAEGIISIDKKTQHTWKPVLIGKIFPKQQFGIVWNSVSTIQPLPYPPFRTKEQWNELLEHWYRMWGNGWGEKSAR